MERSRIEPQRLYALDLLRAVMMLLGLVLHTGITYTVTNLQALWSLKDPVSQHALFDIMVDLIHVFRMPVFFVISGYFSAMLFHQRGAGAMFRNRVNRLVIPFIVGLAVLYPLTIFSFSYSVLKMAGVTDALVLAWGRTVERLQAGPVLTVHLWFLYYLIMFCFTALAIAKLAAHLRKKYVQKLSVIVRPLFWSFWAPLIPVPFLFLCLFMMKDQSIKTSVELPVDLWVFLTYGVLFGFGWFVFQIEDGMKRFVKHHRTYLVIGLLFYFIKTALLVSYPNIKELPLLHLVQVLSALVMWLLIFGIIGLFLRHFDHYSRLGRYISDASYWLYLVHIPFVVLIPSFLGELEVSAFLKFFTVVMVTLVITLSLYNFMVRPGVVGQFLNGRKYPKGLPPAVVPVKHKENVGV